MDLMALVEGLKDYVNLLIPVGFAVVVQIVKTLLANKGIKFKNPDCWVWIVLGLGFFMAWIDYSIRHYEGFTAGGFILLAVIYAALSALAYKVGKIGGKTVKSVFGKNKESGNGSPGEPL